jgi:hypothetical protein
MTNLTQTARALADAFERKTRDNGESFYCLKDGAPDWMQDALHAAHDGGDMMPNDWSYSLAHDMAHHIAEALEYDAAQDAFDIIAEGADSLVPAYNGPRIYWLASHLSRLAFVEEALSDAGGALPKDGGLMAAIGWGMNYELLMIGRALFDAIEGEADEDE